MKYDVSRDGSTYAHRGIEATVRRALSAWPVWDDEIADRSLASLGVQDMISLISRKDLSAGFWAIVSGCSVGFLIGMSATPVIQGVVTSLLALAVTVVTALAGLKGAEGTGASGSGESGAEGGNGGAKPPWRAELVLAPVGCLLAGIVLGSCLGVMTRSNRWLGQSPTVFARTWAKSGLGEQELTRRLLDESYPPATQETKDRPAPGPYAPIFFHTVPAPEYAQWSAAPDDELPRMMATSHNLAISAFALKLQKDPEALRAALGTLIRADK